MCFCSTNSSYSWQCPSRNYSPSSDWVSLFLSPTVDFAALSFLSSSFFFFFSSYIWSCLLPLLPQSFFISHSQLPLQEFAHRQRFHLRTQGKSLNLSLMSTDHVAKWKWCFQEWIWLSNSYILEVFYHLHFDRIITIKHPENMPCGLIKFLLSERMGYLLRIKDWGYGQY